MLKSECWSQSVEVRVLKSECWSQGIVEVIELKLGCWLTPHLRLDRFDEASLHRHVVGIGKVINHLRLVCAPEIDVPVIPPLYKWHSHTEGKNNIIFVNTHTHYITMCDNGTQLPSTAKAATTATRSDTNTNADDTCTKTTCLKSSTRLSIIALLAS